jgi:hypothetical protein
MVGKVRLELTLPKHLFYRQAGIPISPSFPYLFGAEGGSRTHKTLFLRQVCMPFHHNRIFYIFIEAGLEPTLPVSNAYAYTGVLPPTHTFALPTCFKYLYNFSIFSLLGLSPNCVFKAYAFVTVNLLHNTFLKIFNERYSVFCLNYSMIIGDVYGT